MPSHALAAAPADPFFITGPAVISFSGGRTSAYMLWRILQAHGGVLPADVIVCFANTGREMPATLDFVHACSVAWGVRVIWLEYQRDPTNGHVTAEVVSHNSASRGGEPFAALIAGRAFAPNPVRRFCTTELKVRTIRRYCVATYGRKRWAQVVGLRADEPHRVVKMLDPARQKKAGRESRHVLLPLNTAGVDKPAVLAFWAAQSFNLMLRGDWEGNCDGCFLKRKSFIARLWLDAPDRAQWWADQEAAVGAKTTGRGRNFRKDWKGGYEGIHQQVLDNPRLPMPDPGDNGLDPFLACSGCGV